MTMQYERIIEQLDKMVASGRLTPEEAERLRATAGTAGFDEALAAVRTRHARAHTDAAVADGRMSPEDAEALLERVRDGEHSAELRSRIRRAP
jgi:polyhydroxyalkanoate synthesis regulator phasin